MKYDFAAGYKTIAGIVVIVASLLGAQLAEGEILEAVTAIGQALGAVLTAYGLVMKIVRNYKK
ncbi:MAG TPA: hypothetical protein PK505_06325 [Treponemataceae bacterium]|nr:hypothetical protein [Treponemataceae bacterium]